MGCFFISALLSNTYLDGRNSTNRRTRTALLRELNGSILRRHPVRVVVLPPTRLGQGPGLSGLLLLLVVSLIAYLGEALVVVALLVPVGFLVVAAGGVGLHRSG